ELDTARVGDHADTWEKVVRKLRGGLMPPAGAARPDEATYHRFLSSLQTALDAVAAADPNPGRTETVHRLNRIEYVNAVRDPLDAEYDIKVAVTSYRGTSEPHTLEMMIDGVRVKLFTVTARMQPDLRVAVRGGPHDVAVAFLRNPPDLVEQVREPFQNPEAPS